jgi:transposase
LASLMVPNDATGHAAAVEWIARQADGSRVIVGLEGTRSYGIGLARALTATGLTVVEVEHPKREQRRGRGKSDPIDAHLAVLCGAAHAGRPATHSTLRRRPRSAADPARRPQ